MESEHLYFLSPADRDKLLDLLKNPTWSLAELEKKYKETFKASVYDAVSNEIAGLSKELIVSSEGIPFLSSLFIIHVTMAAGYTGAKCVFYSMLVQLERALKKDIYEAKEKEFLSKESEEKKKSAECVRTEIYRIHSCGKVFAFQLLSNLISKEKTIAEIASQKQDALDAQIEKFEQNPDAVQFSISDLFESWKLDNEQSKVSTVLESCAVFGEGHRERAVMTLPVVRAKLPSVPVVPGELQFFVPDGLGCGCFAFDSM